MREGTWDDAFGVASNSFAVLQSEKVALSDANARTLARDLKALCDLPAFATSSMDGWAVCASGPWKVIGEVATGKTSNQLLGASECMKISTGGVIPAGTTAVIPWENATEQGGHISGSVEEGANIRPAGAECKKDELLFKQGTLLAPPMLGLLAATGHDFLEVTRHPRIAIFFLGDELLHTGVPTDGSIRDALGPQIPAVLQSFGAEVVSATFVKDDLDTLNKEIKSALETADIIITTGGTADGPKDYVKAAISHINGELVIDCVKVRPGYHTIVAQVNSDARKIAFLALPGNPQSALAGLFSFGLPLINNLLGRQQEELKKITIASPISTPEGFSRLIPGRVNNGEFTSAEFLGSAMLRGVAVAEGFALINPGSNSPGSFARWIPFTWN
jgi:molybdopterin molybdotransferase